MNDQQRREQYARDWLHAYHGTHPLFEAVRRWAARNPTRTLPPAVVTAVVRFSADEIWKPDPALETKVRSVVTPGVTLSQIATTPAARSAIRAQARTGIRQHSHRRRR